MRKWIQVSALLVILAALLCGQPALAQGSAMETEQAAAAHFQGEITLPSGNTCLDRTTLTPLEEGKVRQVIEVSRDGGQNWRVTFDAVYIPVQR